MQKQGGLVAARHVRVHSRRAQLLATVALTPVQSRGFCLRLRDGDCVHPIQKVMDGRVHGAEPITLKCDAIQVLGLSAFRAANLLRIPCRPAVAEQLQ